MYLNGCWPAWGVWLAMAAVAAAAAEKGKRCQGKKCQEGMALYAGNRSSRSFRLNLFAAAICDFDAVAILGTPVRSRVLFVG